jgi:hypothetical protein
MTCIREEEILLKILSFLHSQSDQIMTIAPILIRRLNLTATPLSQLPNILTTLRVGYKVDPIWTTDHIDLANLHWKNKCLIVSSWWQKTHFLFPCQLRLARLSLVKCTFVLLIHQHQHCNRVYFVIFWNWQIIDWSGKPLDLAVDLTCHRIIYRSGGVLGTNGALHDKLVDLISAEYK